MAVKKAAVPEWEEIGTEQIHLDNAGEEVMGELIGREETVLDVNLYHIRLVDGKEVVLLGSTGLDKKMVDVPDGDQVRIVLNSVVPTRQGYNFKDYRVFKK